MSSNSAWDRQDDTGSYNYFSQGAATDAVSPYRRPLLHKPAGAAAAAAAKPQWQQGAQYADQQWETDLWDRHQWDRSQWDRSSWESSKRAWGVGTRVGTGLGTGLGTGVGSGAGSGARAGVGVGLGAGARRGVPGTRRRLASRASSNQMDTWRFSCKECGMKFNGPVPHKMHLQSPGHQRKVALLSGYGGEPPATDGGVVAAPTPVPKNNNNNNNNSNEVGNSGPGVAVGLRPNPAAATQKGQPPFICEVCNTTMNCEAALLSHKKGKRHLRAVKNLETFGSANLVHAAAHRDSSSLQPRGEASKRSAPSDEGSADDLSCESCGVARFKSADFKVAHFMNDARHANQSGEGGEAASDQHGDNGWEQPLAKMAKVEEGTDWYGQQ